MNERIYSTSGRSISSHIRHIGRFEVRAGNTVTAFNLLEEAYEHFKRLDEEATLWDVTDIPELLESKHLY
ncbi:hypothetical protein EPD60_10725 [Flaviaesturariibacter flavus]|uniref:Uncharacterized protein n=1 Tax=Flaviaesturariibacter flavus TaxID=2502780 RepID=A0A4R1BBR6_9BACT|nr:hypothetical protein [Flaviaesturariibacter flavus]TCJ14456.1 hypothetical protein EPD60_10725 [Flaviaesturariibacter flavus]